MCSTFRRGVMLTHANLTAITAGAGDAFDGMVVAGDPPGDIDIKGNAGTMERRAILMNILF